MANVAEDRGPEVPDYLNGQSRDLHPHRNMSSVIKMVLSRTKWRSRSGGGSLNMNWPVCWAGRTLTGHSIY